MEAMPRKFSGRITCRNCKTAFHLRLPAGPRLLIAALVFAAIFGGVALLFGSNRILRDYTFAAIVLYVGGLCCFIAPYLVGKAGIGALHPICDSSSGAGKLR